MNKKKTTREKVFAKYGGRCAYCGEALKDGWHIDHMAPLKRYKEWNGALRGGRGGFAVVGNGFPERDTLENMLPACASCNINKHELDVEQFRRQIQNFVSSLNERFTQYKLAKRFGLIVETKAPVKFLFEIWLGKDKDKGEEAPAEEPTQARKA